MTSIVENVILTIIGIIGTNRLIDDDDEDNWKAIEDD